MSQLLIIRYVWATDVYVYLYICMYINLCYVELMKYLYTLTINKSIDQGVGTWRTHAWVHDPSSCHEQNTFVFPSISPRIVIVIDSMDKHNCTFSPCIYIYIYTLHICSRNIYLHFESNWLACSTNFIIKFIFI